MNTVSGARTGHINVTSRLRLGAVSLRQINIKVDRVLASQLVLVVAYIHAQGLAYGGMLGMVTLQSMAVSKIVGYIHRVGPSNVSS
jgi:hypothetical protein